MKARNLIAAALVLTLAGACVCKQLTSESTAHTDADGKRVAPLLSCFSRHPRPQGVAYRGQLAELVAYLYDVENGTATAHFARPECRDELVSLTPAGSHEVAGATVDLYVARDQAGDNICRGETYQPSPHEREELGCPATGECDRVAHLKEVALVIPGAWIQGAWVETQEGRRVSTLSCVTGATAKCVLWGYIPGRSYQNTELTPYYRACVQAARARYLGGDIDKSFTCPNTEIEIYDRLGIQSRRTEGLPLESLWSADRVNCVHHARYQRCDAELRDLLSSGNACLDPAPRAGDPWRSGADLEALIAVGSSTANDLGHCPTTSCTRQ